MKKIALCSLMVCLGMVNAYGGTQCKTSLTFSPANNNWNAGSNEYLFETKRDYLNAVNSGYFYECDSSWCPNNSYVKLEAGHVFQNRTIREPAIYKCSTSWSNDKWERVDSTANLTECTKRAYWQKEGIDKSFQNLSADEYLYPTVTDYDALQARVYTQVYECDSTVCADGTILTLPAGHVFQRNDINKTRTYKCVLGSPGDDKWVDITDDCPDCDKKKEEKKPVVKESGGTIPVPNPNPTPNPDPDPTPNPDPVTPTPEPQQEEYCDYFFVGTINCNNGTSIQRLEKLHLSSEDRNGLSCDAFKARYSESSAVIQRLLSKYCPSGYADSKLTQAQTTLKSFFDSAKDQASVWKDSEGKFNTTRLASDLTAGVVLGTVGGVVSGVVIKKKQVEKGFEALHCTVGGQKIADWGDVFSVGLQR